jgi:hypothetical protein
MKTFIIWLLVAVVIAGGVYLWIFPETFSHLFGGGTPAPAPETQTPTDTRATYASTTLGLSIKYPQDWSADEQYAYSAFGPQKLIHGVKFTIPASMATGTNLSPDSYVSVEWLPRAKNCTGDIYLQANVKAKNITDNGVTYSFASSTGAAAGNRYEELVYAIPSSTPCTAVRYFIHSGNIQNYPAGAVIEFNRDTLISAFDDIRRSLVLQVTASAPAPTSSSTPVQ